MRILKIFLIALFLCAGAAAICVAAWIYDSVAGLFMSGVAFVLGGIVLSDVFRDDGHR